MNLEQIMRSGLEVARDMAFGDMGDTALLVAITRDRGPIPIFIETDDAPGSWATAIKEVRRFAGKFGASRWLSITNAAFYMPGAAGLCDALMVTATVEGEGERVAALRLVRDETGKVSEVEEMSSFQSFGAVPETACT